MPKPPTLRFRLLAPWIFVPFLAACEGKPVKPVNESSAHASYVADYCFFQGSKDPQLSVRKFQKTVQAQLRLSLAGPTPPLLFAWSAAPIAGGLADFYALYAGMARPAQPLPGLQRGECKTMENLPTGAREGTVPLQANVAYDVLAQPVDWRAGYTTFFIGLRQPQIPAADFLPKLSQHVNDTARIFTALGLQGYAMSATPDYEIAYLHFASQAASEAAFKQAPPAFFKDAQVLMKSFLFTGIEEYTGNLKPGKLYRLPDHVTRNP